MFSRDEIRGVWAAVDSNRILPTSRTFPELLQDPMVIEKVKDACVIGSLHVVGAMKYVPGLSLFCSN